jgi:hypothetical protein
VKRWQKGRISKGGEVIVKFLLKKLSVLKIGIGDWG